MPKAEKKRNFEGEKGLRKSHKFRVFTPCEKKEIFGGGKVPFEKSFFILSFKLFFPIRGTAGRRDRSVMQPSKCGRVGADATGLLL